MGLFSTGLLNLLRNFTLKQCPLLRRFGPECDSTYWEGPSIIDDGGDCNIVTISPQSIGESLTHIEVKMTSVVIMRGLSM